MLAPAVDGIRLSLHVLAAAVWVGGQIVMAGLVPTARRLGGDSARVLARTFSRLSWPAFVVLVGTGVWNISATHPSSKSSAWQAVLWTKLAVVAVAGVAALAHGRSRSKAGLAVWGSVAGTASVAALVMGVMLAG